MPTAVTVRQGAVQYSPLQKRAAHIGVDVFSLVREMQREIAKQQGVARVARLRAAPQNEPPVHQRGIERQRAPCVTDVETNCRVNRSCGKKRFDNWWFN